MCPCIYANRRLFKAKLSPKLRIATCAGLTPSHMLLMLCQSCTVTAISTECTAYMLHYDMNFVCDDLIWDLLSAVRISPVTKSCYV